MALSTYAELQTAIQTELDKSNTEFTTAVPDLIKRAEAKMNRRLRLRNMEVQATASYPSTNTTRRLAMPLDMLEMLDMWIKPATGTDAEYWLLRQVSPVHLPQWYEQEYVLVYAWRNDIEFNRTVSADHTVKMHYIKKLALASDSTNWALTNFPDAYLYGSLMESELFWANDQRAPLWKQLFEEAVNQMNELDQRSRNDAELNNRQAMRMSGGRGRFNILNTRW